MRLAVTPGVVLGAVVVCSSCALSIAPRQPSTGAVREFLSSATIDGTRLDLHLAAPATLVRADVLVVYASGDGGWFGTAVDQWRDIARAGYATVGFSSRALLRIKRPASAALTRARLSTDYARIIQDAQRALGWPSIPRVILSGWSRGAAFAVLAADEPPVRQHLAGVIAVGLADGEDLAVDGDGDDTDDGRAVPTGRQWPFDTYARLLQLPVPCAVIQATHDNYFPAADAQRRFGADSVTRRFYRVDARNHRFSGGVAAFQAALVNALTWIAPRPASESGLSPSPREPALDLAQS